ncbi:RDD family protein [Thiohalophilus sp.]|uniref:RDD family protein n=1 Tax=Thiohalophilus sp. TaxID=3028392 RepID=UPI002ACDE53C|nr:RDD family protein [Thiohalophilus sp.]MDZ7804820.1 RDD family protein [Thiohalophilus sp.]
MDEIEYAGFWIRVGAALIDSVLVMIIIVPILNAVYGPGYWMSEELVHGGWDVLLNYIFPAVAVIVFWIYKSATPGKMALRLKIVDARTGGKPTMGQFIGRYLGYYVSTIPLLLGLIWVGIDRRKQGWHDKLAGTVVIRDNRKEPVRFEG